MRTSGSLVTLAIGLLLGNVEAAPSPQAQTVDPKCSRNNCMRAVIAGSFPDRPTVADCSSFLRKTVTPAVYTETVWETITPVTETATSITTEVDTAYETITVWETVDAATQTVTATVTPAPPVKRSELHENTDPLLGPVSAEAGNEKRQVTVHPSAIPTYATACKSVEAYSSACSCIGITATTITVATPTVTVHSTSTATAHATLDITETITTTLPVTVTSTESRTVTATAYQTAIPSLFYIRASGPANVNGKNVRLVNFGASTGNVLSFYGTNPDVLFTLSPEGYLTEAVSGNTASTPADQSLNGAFWLYSLNDAFRASRSYKKVTCTISSVDLEINCIQGRQQYLGTSSSHITLGTSSFTPIKLYAIGA